MADGQEPTTNNLPTPPAEGEPTPAQAKTFDEGYVKELRTEAAKYRKELRDLQVEFSALKTEKEGRESAELEQQGQFKQLAEKAQAEAAKLKQQLEDYERALTTERRNNLVYSIAGRLSAHDPADPNFITATQAVDLSAADAAEQIGQIIQKMTETKPYLFKQQSTRVPATESFNPAGPSGQQRESDEQRRKRLFNRGAQVFDTAEAEQRGGGVIWTQKPE